MKKDVHGTVLMNKNFKQPTYSKIGECLSVTF